MGGFGGGCLLPVLGPRNMAVWGGSPRIFPCWMQPALGTRGEGGFDSHPDPGWTCSAEPNRELPAPSGPSCPCLLPPPGNAQRQQQTDSESVLATLSLISWARDRLLSSPRLLPFPYGPLPWSTSFFHFPLLVPAERFLESIAHKHPSVWDSSGGGAGAAH